MFLHCNTTKCVGHHFALSLTLRSSTIGDDFILEMGLFIACTRMVLSVPNGRTIAKKSDKRKALGRRHVSAISDFSQPFSRSERADIKKVELFSPFYPSFYPAFIVFFLEKVFVRTFC